MIPITTRVLAQEEKISAIMVHHQRLERPVIAFIVMDWLSARQMEVAVAFGRFHVAHLPSRVMIRESTNRKLHPQSRISEFANELVGTDACVFGSL